MKVVGEQLVLPRNFEFFRRLPARFQILVISKGAVRAEGTTFEIEIMGQRLTLRSKIELKPGNRYELEKKSVTEFRISREIEKGAPDEISAGRHQERKTSAATGAMAHVLRFDGSGVSPGDLLKVQNLEETEILIEPKGEKVRFDLEESVGLRGLFVPRTNGGYALLVTGASAEDTNMQIFRELVSDLRIASVARVDAATFEHIASGAIDFSG